MSRKSLHRASRGQVSTLAWARPLLIGLLAIIVFLGMAAGNMAQAYEINKTSTTPTGTAGGRVSSLASVSGITTTVTGAGQTFIANTTSVVGSTLGNQSTMFTPQLSNGTPTFGVMTGNASMGSTGCYPGQACPMGTLQVTFSQPVKDPVLHIYGLGSAFTIKSLSVVRAATDLVLDPASSTPGVSVGAVQSGSVNLVSNGATIGVSDLNVSASCSSLTSSNAPEAAASNAGCGSVQIKGVVTELGFNTVMRVLAAPGVTAEAYPDGYGLTFTFGQHYSDAPASYNGSQAPAAVVGDLALGSLVMPNAESVASPAKSPYSEAGEAVNSAAEGEDAMPVWPPLAVTKIGQPYSITVPISGASRAGQVCGYIDFTQAGNFNSAVTRACASFAPGQTSVTLAWTTPNGTKVGGTYARLRANYGTGITSASYVSGLSGTGEVEDYYVEILRGGAGLTLETSASLVDPQQFVVGQIVTYSFVVRNTGDVDLSDVVVNEARFSGSGELSPISCPHVSLTFRHYMTCMADYIVTQNDIDAGYVSSVAVATGTPPAGRDVTSAPSEIRISGFRAPALTVQKSASTQVVSAVGDEIIYEFFVVNNGNLTLRDVAVNDVQQAPAGSFDGAGVVCPDTTLAPGASMICRATYTVAQTDLDHGQIAGTAVAYGTPPATDVDLDPAAIESLPSDLIVGVDLPIPDPEMPVVPTDPENPGGTAEPDNPGGATEPEIPVVPIDPGDPGDVTEPDNPGGFAEPDDPTGTIEPVDPDNTGQPEGLTEEGDGSPSNEFVRPADDERDCTPAACAASPAVKVGPRVQAGGAVSSLASVWPPLLVVVGLGAMVARRLNSRQY